MAIADDQTAFPKSRPNAGRIKTEVVSRGEMVAAAIAGQTTWREQRRGCRPPDEQGGIEHRRGVAKEFGAEHPCPAQSFHERTGPQLARELGKSEVGNSSRSEASLARIVRSAAALRE